MKPKLAIILVLFVLAVQTEAQDPAPIIDMHLHALPANWQGPPPLAMCTSPNELARWDQERSWPEQFVGSAKEPACPDPVWSPETDEELMRQTLAVMERHNVIGVTSGPAKLVARWKAAAPERIIPGLLLNLDTNPMSPEEIRRMHENGELAVLGEVTNQYSGIEPSDPQFEPYLAVAEELDIPVGIHIGTGPPGAPYLGYREYRGRMHSPLTLEDALIRHPNLRVYVMHAGWPMLDDMMALMWTHPQVYVDVGIIVYSLPRTEFYRYLRTLVEAGFGSRVMFGSDQMVWPDTLERAIEVIEEAPFLSDSQKRDILYNNAARFLRLDS